MSRLQGCENGLIAVLAAVSCGPAAGQTVAHYSLTGELIPGATDLHVFDLAVPSPGMTAGQAFGFRTYSYTGGMSAGNYIPHLGGGFDPVLDLYNPGGTVIGSNDDGVLGSLDAWLSWPGVAQSGGSITPTILTPGTYQLRLRPFTPNLGGLLPTFAIDLLVDPGVTLLYQTGTDAGLTFPTRFADYLAMGTNMSDPNSLPATYSNNNGLTLNEGLTIGDAGRATFDNFNRLEIGNGSVEVGDGGEGYLRNDPTGVVDAFQGYFDVGNTGGLGIVLNHGRISTGEISDVGEAGGNGTVFMDHGGVWDSAADLWVGRGGDGVIDLAHSSSAFPNPTRLNLNNGASLSIGYETGAANARGRVELTGLSRLNVTGSVYVGGRNTAAGAPGTLEVSEGAIATINQTLRLHGPGRLTGNGQILAGVSTVNSGEVSPNIPNQNDPIGTLNLSTPTYTQNAGGKLTIQFRGLSLNNHDRLVIAGAAILDPLASTLDLSLVNNYMPLQYQSHAFMSATGGITGVFGQVTGIPVSPTHGWAVTYDPTEVRARLALLGDANLNGQVEQGDLDAVLGNWGQLGKSWVTGDLNGNGQVEQGDLDAVLGHWGALAAPSFGVGTNEASPAPEPASVFVVFMALGCGLPRRR